LKTAPKRQRFEFGHTGVFSRLTSVSCAFRIRTSHFINDPDQLVVTTLSQAASGGNVEAEEIKALSPLFKFLNPSHKLRLGQQIIS